MENHLNRKGCLKLDIEASEFLMGPEDSEVYLKYILTNASRRGSSCEISVLFYELCVRDDSL